MKPRRIIGISILSIFILLVGILIYYNSNFYEVKRVRKEIESDLKIRISELPEILESENYGWAEEGGDMQLLKLNKKDCLIISNFMSLSEHIDNESEYYKLFTKYESTPKSVRTCFNTNKHGDIVHYVLDTSTCLLFRKYHFE